MFEYSQLDMVSQKREIRSSLTFFSTVARCVVVKFGCSGHKELVSSTNNHGITTTALFAMLIYGISNHENGIYMSLSPALIFGEHNSIGQLNGIAKIQRELPKNAH